MTATYTFDVFSSLDGYGAASANWTVDTMRETSEGLYVGGSWTSRTARQRARCGARSSAVVSRSASAS